MKIRFNSNDNLPLRKGLEMHGVVMIKQIFFYDNKYDLQVFLNECLYKLVDRYYLVNSVDNADYCFIDSISLISVKNKTH